MVRCTSQSPQSIALVALNSSSRLLQSRMYSDEWCRNPIVETHNSKDGCIDKRVFCQWDTTYYMMDLHQRVTSTKKTVHAAEACARYLIYHWKFIELLASTGTIFQVLKNKMFRATVSLLQVPQLNYSLRSQKTSSSGNFY